MKDRGCSSKKRPEIRGSESRGGIVNSATRNILAATSGPVDSNDKAGLGLCLAVCQGDQSCQSGPVWLAGGPEHQAGGARWTG